MNSTTAGEPEILYHYTDAGGLLGIVNQPTFPEGYSDPWFDFSRAIKLFASDVRYMNDTAELRFAGRIFAKHFQQASIDEAVEEDKCAIFRDLADELDRTDFYGEPVQVFATCLTANGDQLSQWRGYAGGTGGYAIGISRDVLDHFTYVLPPQPDRRLVEINQMPLRVLPHHVSYAPADAEAAAAQVTAEMMRGPVRPITVPGELDATFWWRWQALAELVLFKDPGFEEEQEWRLIHHLAAKSTGLSAPTEFRQGRFGLVPYVSVAVNLGTAGTPDIEATWGQRPERTIEKLIVGPSPDQALRVSAARQLLQTNGHDPSIVEPSPLPFR